MFYSVLAKRWWVFGATFFRRIARVSGVRQHNQDHLPSTDRGDTGPARHRRPRLTSLLLPGVPDRRQYSQSAAGAMAPWAIDPGAPGRLLQTNGYGVIATEDYTGARDLLALVDEQPPRNCASKA